MKTALIAIALLLTGCGGQVLAKPLNICMQPSDRIVAIKGCDATAQPVHEADPVRSVQRQAQLSGPVVLWAGRKQEWARTVANFPTLISESTKYPGKFPWVYLYDEAGWCDGMFCWFDDEDTVLQGAALAHAVGVKTLITILPDVILHPQFRLKNINAFDGISIDVYPSIRPSTPDFGACRFSDNLLENLMYCSAQKLRRLGFTGQIGYIFQGFGLTTDTPEQRTAYLLQQRQAINNASAMGAEVVMSWGCYLGAAELAAEPVLVPLCGTQYEGRVTP